MKKLVGALFLLSILIFSHFDSAVADASDCYDGCTTACVQPNWRLQRRCEIKCGIRCGRAGFGIEDGIGT
ncbi:hypothetical protein K2173_015481 [Erythroxylum novogranatense]|uniref:Thionin-like protein n=1 Tax=Erythroxylum novogranatense TaxID=1862640 RepID=A0AAV8SSI5_9ROSI|nr:hypothetical protein K2173_015481 [Erythroxylum novogranatense]